VSVCVVFIVSLESLRQDMLNEIKGMYEFVWVSSTKLDHSSSPHLNIINPHVVQNMTFLIPWITEREV